MRSIYPSSLECTWMHFLHNHLVMIHILHTAIFMLRKRLKHNHFRNTLLHLSITMDIFYSIGFNELEP
jgi:hypothetical protein